MRQVALIGIIFWLCGMAPARATPPCLPLTKAEFNQKVFVPSDLAIIGTIIDFSTGNQGTSPQWTKVKVDRVLKGNASKQEITINDWQAYMLPLYGYHKGERLLLLLKQQRDAYKLTESNWKDCVPSIIPMNGDGKVYPFIRNLPKEAQTHPGMTVNAFTQYLLSE